MLHVALTLRVEALFRASETAHSNASHTALHKHSLALKWSPAIKQDDREIGCKVFRRTFFNSGAMFARFDRFVPIRNYSTPCSERYRTNKEPDKLSRTERAMRAGVCPVFRSFPLQQTLSIMYSLFSFRPCPDIGTSNRTGNFQRGLPLFGHGLTSPPDLWPYSQIVSESSTEGSLVHSPTNAHAQSLKRLFAGRQQKSEHERVRNSLGIALNINFFRKILDFNLEPSSASSTIPLGDSVMGIISSRSKEVTLPRSSSVLISLNAPRGSTRSLPVAPFKVLDAPSLRDDFYCSVLAYSFSCQTLAIGLGNIVYTWSDKGGVRSVNGSQQDGTWLTSISFSSVEGNKNLFAAGRSDGTFIVMSLLETAPRFEIQQSCSVACLSWRPCSTLRFSSNPLNPNTLVTTEDLVVGDECGDLYYYLVEWPVASENTRDNWPGSISLVTRISIHSQQICGLAWSPNGALFASGANDNLCCLLKVNEILAPQHLGLHPDDPDAYSPYPNSNFDTLIQMQMTPSVSQASLGWQNGGGSFPTVDGGSPGMTITPQTNVRNLLSGCQSQVWTHQAAVKAIAFCPWLQGLVATGGGSNDKCIHFFHTVSGSSLATISVAAQVTSLIWSNTKREIAATFGYTHPEHPYRIAVFSWPDCSQIAAIPWEDDLRALHAVSYPCILKASKAPNRKPSAVNECIVVASSDKTVKFHEVWSTEGSRAVTRSGMFGGSDILEDLQGIIKEGDVIR
ncbi:hypothetical protein J3459_022587 [Metarhizium acridum]|nr:hypothetical protein J3459_022587 [Metarhizium acridum]